MTGLSGIKSSSATVQDSATRIPQHWWIPSLGFRKFVNDEGVGVMSGSHDGDEGGLGGWGGWVRG